MLTTIAIILGSSSVGFWVSNVFIAFKNKLSPETIKRKEKENYFSRETLDMESFDRLKHILMTECNGQYYADVIVKEIVSQNYRYTPKQIYEIRDIYEKKWDFRFHEYGSYSRGKLEIHINNLTNYYLSIEVEGKNKVNDILLGIDNELLNDNKTMLLND